MGRRQEERAKVLMQHLGQRVTEAMQEQGWRILGKTFHWRDGLAIPRPCRT